MQTCNKNSLNRYVWKGGVTRADQGSRKCLKVLSVEMLDSNLQNSQLLMPCADPAALSVTCGVLFKLYLNWSSSLFSGLLIQYRSVCCVYMEMIFYSTRSFI